VELDGQRIEPDAYGFMVIADPRSPFDGMKCCDYIDFVVKPWGLERDRMMREDRAKAEAAGPGTTFHPNIQPRYRNGWNEFRSRRPRLTKRKNRLVPEGDTSNPKKPPRQARRIVRVFHFLVDRH
jgi:hypothetical protein